MTTAAQIIRPVIKPQTAHTVLLLMRDNQTLCRTCTKENARLIIQATRERDRSGWQAYAAYHHAEGAPVHCAHCNEPQASDYGNPDCDDWHDAARAALDELRDELTPNRWQQLYLCCPCPSIMTPRHPSKPPR